MEYRLLDEGELIQEGDESLDENAVDWNPVHWMHFKSAFTKRFHMPMRRRRSMWKQVSAPEPPR